MFKTIFSAIFLAAVGYTAEPEPKTAADVVARFLTATGGHVLTNRPSYRATGSFELIKPPVTGSLEVLGAAPNKQRLRVDIPSSGLHDRGFDGLVRWSFNPRPGYRRDEKWTWQSMQGYQLEDPRKPYPVNEALDLYAWLHQGPQFETMFLAGKTNFQGKATYAVASERLGRTIVEYFDTNSWFRVGMDFGGAQPERIVFSDYRGFGSLQIPTVISREEKEIVRDRFKIDSLDFVRVHSSAFSIPVHAKTWPPDWHQIEEAYPPEFAKNLPWPWRGEHRRWFNEGFSKKEDEFFWSYAICNTLIGDTLHTAEEVKAALHRYDASLYGQAYSPDKILVEVLDQEKVRKASHDTVRYAIKIEGFDAEATKQTLTTHLQVFRWYCPVADRTVFLILRSPRIHKEQDSVWQVLDQFWNNLICHI
jgi:hypothetical protein